MFKRLVAKIDHKNKLILGKRVVIGSDTLDHQSEDWKNKHNFVDFKGCSKTLENFDEFLKESIRFHETPKEHTLLAVATGDDKYVSDIINFIDYSEKNSKPDIHYYLVNTLSSWYNDTI